MTKRKLADTRKGDTPYLFQRVKDHTWYCRVAVPPSLRHLFNGKRNLVRSLNTKILGQAKALRDDEVARLKKMLRDAKAANPANAGDVVRAAQLRELELKWQRKIRRDKFGMTVKPMTAKDEAEYEKDRALAYELGSPRIAESLGRPAPRGMALDTNEDEFFKPLEPKTRIQYRHSLKILRDFLKAEGLPETIESVDGKTAVAFRKHLIGQELHRKTAAAHLSANRSRWQHLINEQIIEPPNPWVGISMPREKRGKEPPRRPFTDAELVTLFEGDPGQPLFDIMTLLLVTGLRRGEPMAMKVKDYQAGWFHVREGKTASAVRRVPAAKLIRPALERMLEGRDPDSYLFNEESKAQNQSRGNLIGQHFLRYRRSVNVGDARTPMHSLRHVAATKANDAGHARHDIQGVIGHDGTKRSVSDIYTVIGDAKKVEIIESIVKSLPRSVVSSIKSRFGKP